MPTRGLVAEIEKLAFLMVSFGNVDELEVKVWLGFKVFIRDFYSYARIAPYSYGYLDVDQPSSKAFCRI